MDLKKEDEDTKIKVDEFNKTIREGWLEKQGLFVKNWKRRYFDLKKGSLLYYAKPQDKVSRGIISLVQASVVLPSHPGMMILNSEYPPFCFGVKTGARMYVIKCRDNEEREEWMISIKQNCI